MARKPSGLMLIRYESPPEYFLTKAPDLSQFLIPQRQKMWTP